MDQTSLFLNSCALLGGVWLMLYLTAAFVPLITLCRVLSRDRSPLQGHLAGQLLRLGGLVSALQILLPLGVAALNSDVLRVLLQQPDLRRLFTASGVLIGLAVVLTIGMGLGWSTLRKKKRICALMLAHAMGFYWVSLWTLYEIVRRLWLDAGGLAPILTDSAVLSLPWFTQTLSLSMGVVLTGLIWLYGPGLAGGMSLLWLLIRRNRDDFGRDYYGFAARVCASFAAAGGLLAIMSATGFARTLMHLYAGPFAPTMVLPAWLTDAGELVYGLLGADTVQRMGLDAIPHALGMLCLSLPVIQLLAAFLWFLAARSAVPMRNKLSMILGLILYAAGLLLALDLFRLAHSLLLPPLS